MEPGRSTDEGFSRRPFTVDEVLRMADAGIFGDGEHVELLDGELVVVSPEGPIHACTLGRLRDRLASMYVGRAVVREDKPLVVGTRSMPEPDLTVVPGSHADHVKRHPRGREAALVIEVCVTGHREARRKTPIYARGSVAVYWLVDVPARRVEVYSGPTRGGRYRRVRILSASEALTLPGTRQTLQVSELFELLD